MRDTGGRVDGAQRGTWGHVGSHINARALSQKILRSRVFYPSIATDAQDYVGDVIHSRDMPAFFISLGMRWARPEFSDLSFSRIDFGVIKCPHENPQPITPVIANFEMGRMLDQSMEMGLIRKWARPVEDYRMIGPWPLGWSRVEPPSSDSGERTR
ncbi:hypothetical protein LIER_21570 [Lithospermum erythrorhizon]|uniref:Uncharacterized protein n=1 Tax=Lithospermum erythrorhizon TaxID=34254 RepID=A0AAV3QQN4_LITER